AEPLAKINIRVFEHSADQHGKAITAAGSAGVALPMERAGMRLNLGIAATRARHELGPAMFGEVQLAGVFVREHPLKIADGHLMDRLAFPLGHDRPSPTMRGE